MKRFLLFMYLSVLSVLTALAEGTATMSLSNVSLKAGEEATLYVELTNPEDQITGVQCDLYLPEGISIKKDQDGEFISQVADRINSRKPHTLAWAVQKDGAMRLLNYSTTNQLYKGTSGAIIEVTLVADKNIAPEDHNVWLRNIVVSHPNGSVIKPADFTSKITVKPAEYSLIYILDGNEFFKQELAIGSVITPKEVPAKEGHTFSGWKDLPQTMPAHDVICTGSYTANEYKVRFVADGKVVSEQSMAYGTEIVAPEAPEKEGYTFTGWGNVDKTVPAHDVTYKAEYKVNYYKLTYILNGEIFAEDEIAYNSVITPREVEESDKKYFSGWEGMPETMPAHDVTVYGNILSNINSINNNNQFVTVFSINGSIVKQNIDKSHLSELLPPGIYIVAGKKIILR